MADRAFGKIFREFQNLLIYPFQNFYNRFVMNVFIPTKEELDDAIYRAVKKVILEELPGAILKAGDGLQSG